MTTAFEINPGTFPKAGIAIREMRERLENIEPILKLRAALLSTVIDDSFSKSVSPLGEVWAPLADSTVDKRRKGSSKPLVDTAQLRQATNARTRDKSIVFGTSGAPAKYGVFHVTGTKNMARRSYLPLDKEGTPDFSSGPAAAWLEKTRNAVIGFILHGENRR